MKRTAVSAFIAITVLYTVSWIGPERARETFATRTIAQEATAPKKVPDPFQDPPNDKTIIATVRSETGKENLPVKPDNAGTPIPPNPSEAVESKLALPANHEFPDTPLQDVMDALSQRLGIMIVLDAKALEDAGVGTDKTINVNLRALPTDKFLDLITRDLELTWLVRDGYLLVTTREMMAEAYQEVRVYNCSDLIEFVDLAKLQNRHGNQGGFGGGMGGGGGAPAAGAVPDAAPAAGRGGGGFFAVPPGTDPAAASSGGPPMGAGAASTHTAVSGTATPELAFDYDSLIDLIETTIEPDSWVNAGGNASIESYHGGLIVISHHGQAHRRIETLLKMLRQAKKAEPGTVVRER